MATAKRFHEFPHTEILYPNHMYYTTHMNNKLLTYSNTLLMGNHRTLQTHIDTTYISNGHPIIYYTLLVKCSIKRTVDKKRNNNSMSLSILLKYSYIFNKNNTCDLNHMTNNTKSTLVKQRTGSLSLLWNGLMVVKNKKSKN